jgi:hypothetical protein
VNGSGRNQAEFGAEVTAVRLKLRDQRGTDAKPDVELFDGVVIDGIELDILIAPALSGRGVFLAQQIEFASSVFLRNRRSAWRRSCGALLAGKARRNAGQENQGPQPSAAYR